MKSQREDFACVNQLGGLERHLRLHQIAGANLVLRAPFGRATLRVARHFPRLRVQRRGGATGRQNADHHPNQRTHFHVSSKTETKLEGL
jgi:hypothetical protein